MSKLTLPSHVKPSEDVVWRNLQGESVLLDLKSGVYFGLDAVGTRIWALLQDRDDLQAVLEELLAEYDVSEEACARDLLDLVSVMAEKGLVQVDLVSGTGLGGRADIFFPVGIYCGARTVFAKRQATHAI